MLPFKKKYLEKEYVKRGRSFADIAKEWHVPISKVRRVFLGFGLKPRSRARALKIAYKKGRKTSPTKGRKRTWEEKEKIRISCVEAYKNMSPKKKEQAKKLALNVKKVIGYQMNRYYQKKGRKISGRNLARGKKVRLTKFLLERIPDTAPAPYYGDFLIGETVVFVNGFFRRHRSEQWRESRYEYYREWGFNIVVLNDESRRWNTGNAYKLLTILTERLKYIEDNGLRNTFVELSLG